MPGLATQFNHNILKGQTDPRGGSASVFHDNDHRQAALSDVVSNLFGQGVNVSRIAAPNALRVHQSSNHALTGLPYSLDGESSVISQEVDNWVAAYDDPITAILGTSFHQHNREIYVTRTWYEGGGTTVIPERGRGHTMTKKEKAYHVITIRIGNEIEMNLNLFLLPNRAHKDFREFMSHQKESIMQTIRAMGWEAVMEHGFHMGAILGKIDTTSSGITDPLEVRLRNERTVAESVTFGLTSPFGLANLLQLASRCNTRVPSGTSRKPYSLVVVPHGFMSNQQLTKKEDMVAYVRGHPTCPETTIRRKLEISSYDIGPYRAVEVMPLGTHHKGGDSSEVMPSPLESSVIFAMYYTEKQKGAWLFEDDEMENAACVVCKFDTPQWKKLTRLCLQQTALATFLYRSLVDSEWPQTTPLTLEAEDALANNPTFHKLWVGDDNENVDRQSGTVAVHVIREMDNAWIRSRGQHGRIAPWWAASRVVLHDGVHCLKTEEDDTNTVYNIVYDTPDVWAHLDIDMVKLHLVFRQLYVFWTLPQFEARAESMVFVANPGPEVGEMIMQHSKLGISTNQMTETVEVSLRMHLLPSSPRGRLFTVRVLYRRVLCCRFYQKPEPFVDCRRSPSDCVHWWRKLPRSLHWWHVSRGHD